MATQTLNLEIVSAERRLFTGVVQTVQVSGSEGELVFTQDTHPY